MALNFLELPLAAVNQRFSVFLGSKLWYLTLRWNEDAQAWVLDFSDKDNVPTLRGVPLVTGVDLLQQHRHLGFEGGLLVQTSFDALAAPTYDSLGDTSKCFFFQEVR